jgi:hypothetical protein
VIAAMPFRRVHGLVGDADQAVDVVDSGNITEGATVCRSGGEEFSRRLPGFNRGPHILCRAVCVKPSPH